jgi:hypothetical protein
MVNP